VVYPAYYVQEIAGFGPVDPSERAERPSIG